MKDYDFIIAGAGAAGLSLLMHMITSDKFNDKKILLAERSPKNINDRTWCFWEKEQGLFEPIVYRKWDRLWFHELNGQSQVHEISPYQYKLIRGIDFYNYCFSIIEKQPNITIEYGPIESITGSESETSLSINKRKFNAGYIFNSILQTASVRERSYFLLQHFRGWFIKTNKNVFDPSIATLMDFRVSQNNATTFVYIMPFSETEALVEYTLFSDQTLNNAKYNEALRVYCKDFLKLQEDDFEITSEETGVIPMTNYKFPKSNYNIINIGSAGGQTKPSSGYTFRFIQKHSANIVESLIKTGTPHIQKPATKFAFYDSVLLNILTHNKYPGAKIFSTLFRNNKMKSVFKFLDNETSLPDELSIISKLPTRVFASAAFSHLLRR